MPFRTSDVFRSEIITAPELLSDGYGENSIYLFATLSTTAATQTIDVILPFPDVSLVWSQDFQIKQYDLVYLYGTSPGGVADGYYTINQVLNDTSITVFEPIANSTGGNIQFRFPPGAKLVGFDPTGLPTVQANNLQDAVTSLDQNKLSPSVHETLPQLIHFIETGGPGHGFSPTPYKEVTPFANIFPTAITWYIDNTKTQKIMEKLIVWNGIVPSTITWNVYQPDGVTIAQSATDTITYQNTIFEISRTRVLS
jgi:hypothetical protein